MRPLMIVLPLLFSIIVWAHEKPAGISKLDTKKYAGSYSFGKSAEKGRVGYVTIYPETDSTVLFYLELNIGPPSYNMGSLYDRLHITGDSGVYYQKMVYYAGACKLCFKFEKDNLRIYTVNGQGDCGFGCSVFADGVYLRKSSKIIDRFYNLQGDTVYFKSFKSEN